MNMYNFISIYTYTSEQEENLQREAPKLVHME